MGMKTTSPITKPTLPLASPADCFRTYVQARVFGTREFEWRRKGTQICLYAWDIALFPEAALREQQIELLWRTCEPLTPKQASQDLAVIFKRDVRALVACKRDLLPSVTTFIDDAKLEAVDDTTDRLVVTTAIGAETRLVYFTPDSVGALSLRRRLYRLRDWAEDLTEWVDVSYRLGRMTHEECAECVATGSMMRVELAGFREFSARLHAIQTAPATRRVAGEWGRLIDEIDAQISQALSSLR